MSISRNGQVDMGKGLKSSIRIREHLQRLYVTSSPRLAGFYAFVTKPVKEQPFVKMTLMPKRPQILFQVFPIQPHVSPKVSFHLCPRSSDMLCRKV